MKTLKLLAISASLSLSACATHTAAIPEQFLQPCVIEGPHKSLGDVMGDPTTTTRSLIDFAGQAEDTVTRCNADKASALRILKETP